MERADTLFARIDESNTETPRSCHIIALRLAGTGLAIPEDVQSAVLSSAERGQGVLKRLMSEDQEEEFTLRERFLRLAAQIAFSHGVNGPIAFQRRLEHLREAVYKDGEAESSNSILT